MKVITICGSLKFQNEMMSVSEKLSLEGNCVFTPVYPVIKRKRTKEELDNLKKIHFKKIELSDAIFVINKDKYIGCLSSEVIEASLMENALECIEPVMKQEIKNNNSKEKSLCLGSKITFEK